MKIEITKYVEIEKVPLVSIYKMFAHEYDYADVLRQFLKAVEDAQQTDSGTRYLRVAYHDVVCYTFDNMYVVEYKTNRFIFGIEYYRNNTVDFRCERHRVKSQFTEFVEYLKEVAYE